METQTRRPTILIVDDSPECTSLLHEVLGERYSVITANDGNKGLLLAKGEHAPDVILLDIKMPGMDGYEVCHLLKSDPRLARIPVIFLSGLETTEDKVRAFQTGGVDYITKPFQLDEVRARVSTHLRLRQIQQELELKQHELEAAYGELDREFRTVGEVLAQLLPASLPEIPGFDCASWHRLARRAGGDYFDLLPIDGRRWGLFVADVSGHGPPAAVVSAMIHIMLHLAPHKEDPCAVMTFLNDSLAGRVQQDQFVTAFYGVLDPTAATLLCIAAGHPPPVHIRCDTNTSVLCPLDEGLPFGIRPGEQYRSTTLSLSPGDLLVCYTDGIIEAENSLGEMYGIERLLQLTAACRGMTAKTCCSTLHNAVETFLDGAEQADDVTLLVIKMASPGEEAERERFISNSPAII